MKTDYNKKYRQNNIKQEKEKNENIEEKQLQENLKIEDENIDKKEENKVNDEIKESIVEKSVIEEKNTIEEKIGIVVNCDLLNVRKEPNSNSDILTIINKDQKIKIIEELEEFYKVLIDDNEAYCMKKFIKIS